MLYVCGDAALREWARGATLNTDRQPYIEYTTPKSLFEHRQKTVAPLHEFLSGFRSREWCYEAALTAWGKMTRGRRDKVGTCARHLRTRVPGSREFCKWLEQLVIEEELRKAKVWRPGVGIGAWALPTIIMFGTDEQKERWVTPTLRGQFEWCQLFSEPGAGSDLASLSTKATRDGDGWRLTGQKVWTSLAGQSDWGICLARTSLMTR